MVLVEVKCFHLQGFSLHNLWHEVEKRCERLRAVCSLKRVFYGHVA